MTLRRIIPALAIALMAGAPVASGADPLVVAGAMTIEGGTHTYTEQVIVLPGSTLTINNATIYLDAPRSCPIGGTIQFCHPQLFVMPGGTLIADGATFDTNRPVDINNATTGYMVYAYGGVLTITDSTFNHANVVGGELPGPAPSVITDSHFNGGIQAIAFIRGMEALIEGNTIENHRLGIDVRDANSTIRGNTISVLGYGIDVQSTLVGDKVLPTRATVEGNVVRNSLGGLFTLNGYGSTVRNNSFIGNTWGAILGVNAGDEIIASEQIVFTGNLLQSNINGVRSYATVNGGQSEPRAIVVPVTSNSFIGTTCTQVIVTEPVDENLSLTVDARSNWWGSAAGPAANGPDCPATVGAVDIDPWLTEPPA